MSSHIPAPYLRLVDLLRQLPGIGKRAAQKMALNLLTTNIPLAEALAHELRSASRALALCHRCHALAESSGDMTLCRICQLADIGKRELERVCVVEKPSDVWNLENVLVNEFRGVYHVLHGVLSPLKGYEHDDLEIDSLVSRIEEGEIHEVILATSSTLEGEATSLYLSKLLEGRVLVTRLAQGIAKGTELDNTDDITLVRAFLGRVEL